MLNIIANESHVVVETFDVATDITEVVYIPYTNIEAVNYQYLLDGSMMEITFTVELFGDNEYEFTDSVPIEDFDSYEETLAINCEEIMNKMAR